MTKPPARRPATEVAHLGRDPSKHAGAVNTPVYRATTMLFDCVADLEAAERGEFPGISYGLHGLPTVTDLQDAVARLEGGFAALAVPSGLAAITLALLAVLRAGDHVLVSDSVYGPTRRFCDNQLTRFGVAVTYYDPLIGGGIDKEIRDNTKVVYAESPGSLSFEVQDIPAIAAAAHARGALLMIDNTWATPLGFASFAHGADISLHAGTKYLGGHSDVLNGMIVCNQATHARMHRLWTDMGVAASSDDCFLALRGLRTLAVRLERHTRSALTIAQWLRERPEVAEVIYPALPGSRGHDLWKRDFTGACGLFGFVLHPVDKARVDAMLDGLSLFRMGWSWGGFESLIIPTHPGRTRTATRWQTPGPCVRLHVGLEDPQDLMADLDAGFARLRA
jgi:cystathionine beta-lyase